MTVDWRQLYPFASHTLPLGSWRYHYLDEGSGEPLLMVHGNPTWSFYWRNLILAFRDRYRVVAPDHMGCGWSDKPQAYPYCLSTHIANLVQLIEHLDLRAVTLLVHDWGGPIGLGAALRVPDRIARLVLFNTGAFASISLHATGALGVSPSHASWLQTYYFVALAWPCRLAPHWRRRSAKFVFICGR